MFRILFILIAGIAVGLAARRTRLPRAAERGIRITVPTLLFVFGTAAGADDAVIALLGIAGSIAAARVAKRIIGKGGGR